MIEMKASYLQQASQIPLIQSFYDNELENRIISRPENCTVDEPAAEEKTGSEF